MSATLDQVDRVGKPLGLKRSEIVQGLQDWLRKNAVESFEREWISALDKKGGRSDAS